MAVIRAKTADLVKNYRILRKELGDVRLLAFVKANGYGLGTEWMVQTLYDAGQRIFCTARPEEALEIRALFEDVEVWLCSVCDEEATLRRLIDADVTVAVDSIAGLERLSSLYGSQPLRCHVSIDTGMGRNGVSAAKLPEFINACKLCSNLAILSTFTHYANCYGGRRGEKATMEQNARFVSALEQFRAAGVPTGIRHASNSAATLLYPGLRMDAVRVGSGLLGRCVGAGKLGLERVGELTATVLSLHTLQKGDTLGYGSVFRARGEKTVAMIDAGHCDGVFLNRSIDGFRFRDTLSAMKRALLTPPLTVTVNGKKVRVLGRVGLTDLAIDASKGNLKVGDTVCLDFNPVLGGAKNVLHE